jgi:thiol-disulfide isomerase/thioredoxin
MTTHCKLLPLRAILAISVFLASAPLAFSADSPSLTFFAWSDQHVKTDGNAEHLVPPIYIMNAIPGYGYPSQIGGKVDRPAFVIGAGDITEWPTEAARDIYDKYITLGLRYPSFDLAGNHDLGGKEPSRTITDWLRKRHGALSYSFDISGVHFLMLFSEYDDSLDNPAQPISAAALTFLKSDLAKIAKDTPVVVTTHLCYDAITNKDPFVDALTGTNVIAVLGGHYHSAKVDKYRNVNFVQLPSPSAGSPGEFTVVRITENRITAIPFDYETRTWATDSTKILDAQIKGPKPLAPSEKHDTLKIGSPAPDFFLPGIDNRYCGLSDFASADILTVIFTCNHCPTAQAYEQRIKALHADYKDKSVAIVAISPNDPLAVRLDELGYSDLSDSFDEMKIRARDAGFTFPYLYDGDTQGVSRAYGPVATPHVFIFDKARKLRFVGRIDNSENREVTSRDTRNALDALIAGKPVPVETTPVFGCSVKWSEKRSGIENSFNEWAKEDVSLKTIDPDGVKKLLKNDSQKLRFINVWATWCGPCRKEFPDLINIHRMYRNRPFEMITINTDEPAEKDNVLDFLRQRQASTTNYIFALDDAYKLADALGGRWSGSIPFTLIVKPGGDILATYEGMIDPLETRKAIVDYLGRTYK